MDTIAVVLAAGKGTRMRSERAKVLHRLLDRTMIEYVVRNARDATGREPVVVIGHGGQQIQELLGEKALYVWQHEQRGTGHAVMQALPAIETAQTVLVVCGDTPLIRRETLETLLEIHRQRGNGATVLTVEASDPGGYGRVVRETGDTVREIVEDADCTPAQREIREINTGTYCFEGAELSRWLAGVRPGNQQKEYYLTDVVAEMNRQGKRVEAYRAPDEREVQGINTQAQLAQAARTMQEGINRRWMDTGVTLLDPSCTYIGRDVIVAGDVEIWPHSFLEGDTVVGAGTVIGPGCRLRSAAIGARCRLEQSIVLESRMGDDCVIGPFAYIRPGTELSDRVKVGDFVELKKTRVARGSKIPHHSYVGDAVLGEDVNIGAGTITCNYDGVHKHQTTIDDGVFVGSNTNLVAPVHLHRRSYVAAGSTITDDVPEDSLAIARGRQSVIVGWRKKKGI